MNTRPPAIRSEPVRWWLLITEMERIRTTLGLGQAAGWSHVHRGELEAAETVFRDLCQRHGADPGAVGSDRAPRAANESASRPGTLSDTEAGHVR